MKKRDFIEQLSGYIAEGKEISPETRLTDLPGWDSIGKLTVIALISKVDEDLTVDTNSVRNFSTVQDIINTISDKLEE